MIKFETWEQIVADSSALTSKLGRTNKSNSCFGRPIRAVPLLTSKPSVSYFKNLFFIFPDTRANRSFYLLLS